MFNADCSISRSLLDYNPCLLSMQRLYCIYKQGFTANQQDVNGYIVVCIMKFILYR